MLKKTLALAAVLLFATAGVAGAQTYPPADTPSVEASDTTPAPGQQITLTADGFLPGSSSTFTLFSAPVVLGTATANAQGVASLTTAIPANTTPGSHRVEVSGTGANGQPLTVVLPITVTGAAGSNLPTTGTDSALPLTQIAIGVMAFGGLMVVMANKRRTANRDTAGV